MQIASKREILNYPIQEPSLKVKIKGMGFLANFFLLDCQKSCKPWLGFTCLGNE
jgi:hypothetical protein